MSRLGLGLGLTKGGMVPFNPLNDNLVDSEGYYFFDPQSLSWGAVTSWDGSIPTSSNDLSLVGTQGTAPDQPQTDGSTVTFADNTDHIDIPSTSQAGWQVVGTSLGTFAYKVDSDSITELNLLGNLGNATYRQTGDLYGLILLPESATSAEVEQARQILIGRGAADAVSVTDLHSYWRDRADIEEFGSVDTSGVTNFSFAWRRSSLTAFPLLDTSSGTNFSQAWNNTNLTSFPLLDTSSGENFGFAWRSCSGLTSFPLLNTSSGTNFSSAWQSCTSLSTWPAGFFDSWNPSSISSGVFNLTWLNCTSLTAQSVENILTSLDTSGKFATTSGASGGTALADAGIDIDYNGDPLSAATNTAITSLKTKGWGISLNGALQ